jgi:uncharacterized cupredoxin-like copper-binding protein
METLRVDLQPAPYEVYCPAENHANRGMTMALTASPAS